MTFSDKLDHCERPANSFVLVQLCLILSYLIVGKIVNIDGLIYPSLNIFVTLSFSVWELSPFSLRTRTSAPKRFSSFEIQAAKIKIYIFLDLSFN